MYDIKLMIIALIIGNQFLSPYNFMPSSDKRESVGWFVLVGWSVDQVLSAQ